VCVEYYNDAGDDDEGNVLFDRYLYIHFIGMKRFADFCFLHTNAAFVIMKQLNVV